MDPITHALIGGALYKVSGGQASFSDPQFISIVAGAVAPDIDIVIRKWGRLAYLKAHRGVTHSVVGLIGVSLAITFVVLSIYNSADGFNIFFYSLLGCISHVLFDVLNSYGTRIFWPFFRQKVSLNTLSIFDPVIFVLLMGIIVSNQGTVHILFGLVIGYIIYKMMVKHIEELNLARLYGVNINKVIVMPSVIHLNKWHFIVKRSGYSIVGQKNSFKREVNIIKRFYNIGEEVEQIVLDTRIAKFFKEFTPLYNIEYEYKNGEHIFTFVDMRYFLRDNFMHYASAVFTKDYELKEEVFYSNLNTKPIYL